MSEFNFAELAGQQTQDRANQKKFEIQQKALQKRASIQGLDAAQNIDEYMALNPTATELEVAEWNTRNLARTQLRESTEGIVGDSLVGAGEMAVTLAERVPATAKILSRPQDAVRGISDGVQWLADRVGYGNEYEELTQEAGDSFLGDFASALDKGMDEGNPFHNSLNSILNGVLGVTGSVKDSIGDFKSNAGRLRDQVISEDIAAFEENIDRQLGDNPTSKQIKDAELAKTWFAVKHTGARGYVEGAIESIPMMLSVGNVASKTDKKTREELKDSGLTQKQIDIKAAKNVGSASTTRVGALEGASNYTQAHEGVMAMSEEELNKSPEYQKLRLKMSPEKAKAVLADKFATRVGAGSAVVGKIAATVFGVGLEKMVGGVAKVPKTKVGKAGRVAADTVGETLEEGVQSGAGKALENQATKELIDENTDTTKGVSSAAGVGAVTGGLSAAGTTATVATVKKAVKLVAGSAEKRAETKVLNETLTRAEELENSVIEGIDASRAAAEEGDLETAKEAFNSFGNDHRELYETLQALGEPTNKNETQVVNDLTERLERVADAKEQWVAEYTEKHFKGKENEEVNQAAVSNVASQKNPTKEDIQRVEELLTFSPESISVEQAEAISKTGLLTGSAQSVIESMTKVRKGLDRSNVSTAQVADQIIDGDPDTGFVGLNEYTHGIYESVLQNDVTKQEKLVRGLRNFRDSHQRKLSLFNNYFEAVKNNKGVQLAKQALVSAGALRSVNTKISPKVVDTIAKESKLIDDTYTSLQSVFTIAEPSKAALRKPLKKQKGYNTLNQLNKAFKFMENEVSAEVGKAYLEFLNQGDLTESDLNSLWDIASNPNRTPEEQARLDTVTSKSLQKHLPETSTFAEKFGLEFRNQDGTVPQTIAQLNKNVERAIAVKNKNTSVKPTEPVSIETSVLPETEAVTEPEVSVLPKTDSPNTKVEVEASVLPTEKEETTPTESKESEVNSTALVEPASNEGATRADKLSATQFIKDYFTQSKTVVGIKEALDKAFNDAEFLRTLLPEDFFTTNMADTTGGMEVPITTVHRTALQTYMNIFNVINTKARSTVEGMLVGSLPNARNNYASHLLAQDNTLPEDTFQSLVASGYTWMADRGVSNLINDIKDIQKIMGLEKGQRPSKKALRLYRKVGTTREAMVQELGQLAASSLGLRAKKDVDKNAQANLETSLGIAVYELLNKSGYLKETRISNADAIAAGNKNLVGADNVQVFTTLKNISPDLLANESNSGGLIGAIFNPNNYGDTQPTLSKKAAIKRQKASNKMQGTTRTIAKRVKEILVKQVQQAYRLKETKLALLEKFTHEQQALLNGYMTEEEIAQLPAHKRESQEAINDGINRSLNKLRNFTSGLEARTGGRSAKFYFLNTVWRNLRVGLKSITVNPQSDSIHRHFMGLDSDVVSIKLGKGSKEEKNFLLAVALGLGVSTDKLKEATSLLKLQEILNTPILQDGVKAIRELKSGAPVSEESFQVIKDAVKAGGEGAYSLEALEELANYFEALDNSKPVLHTSIVAESDGITNGPSFGVLFNTFLKGITTPKEDAEGKKKLTSAGYFFSRVMTSFGKFKEALNSNDMYELVVANVANILKSKSDDRIAPLHMLIGSLVENGKVTKEGRDFGKDPLMGNVYGQGSKSVEIAAGEFGFDRISSKLFYDGADSFGTNIGYVLQVYDAKIAQIENTIDAMKRKGSDTKKISGYLKVVKQEKNAVSKLTYDQFASSGFSLNTQKTLEEAISATYGSALAEAIETEFPLIKSVSTPLITAMTGAMYWAYQAEFNTKVKERIAELTAEGKFDKKLEFLSQEEMDSIRESLGNKYPAMHTYFTNETGNKTYAVEVGKYKKSTDKTQSKAVSLKGSMSIHPPVKLPEDPGVSAVAASIHSIDSTVMLLAQDILMELTGKSVTNIFDAVLGGVATIDQATTALNQATLEVVKNTHPIENARSGMMQTFENNEAMYSDTANTQKVMGKMIAFLDKTFGLRPTNMVPVLQINNLLTSEPVTVTFNDIKELDIKTLHTMPDDVTERTSINRHQLYSQEANLLVQLKKAHSALSEDEQAKIADESIFDTNNPLAEQLQGYLLRYEVPVVVGNTHLSEFHLPILAQFPRKVVPLFNEVAKVISDSAVEGTKDTINDMTYIVQYNKEGQGISVKNGKEIEVSVKDGKALDKAFEDAATEAVKKTKPKEVEQGFTDQLSAYSVKLINVFKSSLPLGKSVISMNVFENAAKGLLTSTQLALLDTLDKDHSLIIPYGLGESNDKIKEEILLHVDSLKKQGVIPANYNTTDAKNYLESIVNDMDSNGVVQGTSVTLPSTTGKAIGIIALNTNVSTYTDTGNPRLDEKGYAITGAREETLTHELDHTYLYDSTMNQLKNNPKGDIAKSISFHYARAVKRYNLINRKIKAGKEVTTEEVNFKTAMQGVVEGYTDNNIRKAEFITWARTNDTLRAYLATEPESQGGITFALLGTLTDILKALYADVFGKFNPMEQASALNELEVIAYKVRSETFSASTTPIVASQKSSQQQIEREINSANATTILSGLAAFDDPSAVGQEHSNFLVDLVGELSSKILEPLKLDQIANSKGWAGVSIKDKLDISRQDPDAAPNTNHLDRVMGLSLQEAYAYQLTRNILNTSLNELGEDRRYATRLYNHVKKYTTFREFLPEGIQETDNNYAEEVNKAKLKRYKIFQVKAGSNGESKYLHDFIALTQTSEEMKRVVSKLPDVPIIRGSGNVLDIVQHIENIIRFGIAAISGEARALNNPVELSSRLVKQSIRTELENKNILFKLTEALFERSTQALSAVYGPLDSFLKQGISMLPKAVRKYDPVSTIVRATNLINHPQAKYVGSFVTQALGSAFKGMPTFASALFNEFRGEDRGRDGEYTGTENEWAIEMLRKNKHTVDHAAQEVVEAEQQVLLQQFSTKPSREVRKSLTKALIKTDISSLPQYGYTEDQITKLLSDKQYLAQEIQNARANLHKVVPNRGQLEFYKRASKAMGVMMATNVATEVLTLRSVNRIANLAGTGSTPVTTDMDAVKKYVDILGTLHAIHATPDLDKRNTVNVINEEMRMGTDNAFTYTLTRHNLIKEEAANTQFTDNPDDFVKGYIPSILNPSVGMTVSASSNDKDLLAQGYYMHSILNPDIHDPVQDKRYVYVHPTGGTAGYSAGIMYLNDNKAQGANLTQGRTIIGSGMPSYEAALDRVQIRGNKNPAINAMFAPKPKGKLVNNYMVPSFDLQGEIKDFRYIMTDSTKEEVFSHDEDLFNILPKMSGDNIRVPSAKDANMKLVEAMKQQYELDKANNNLGRYVYVKATSEEPRLKEAWLTMPVYMKEAVEAEFKTNSLPIRNDLFDLIIGDRKVSSRELWNAQTKDLRGSKFLTGELLNTLTAGYASKVVPRIEQGVIELGKMVTDIIINKSGVVLAANVTSNNNFLIGKGLSGKYAFDKQREAYILLKTYMDDKRELNQLVIKAETTTNPNVRANLDSRIAKIQDNISRNKITKFTDEGLLPNISEGEDTITDTYSYKGKITEMFDTAMSKLPKRGKEVADELAISHETSLYKFLSRGTSISDFAARYALIEYKVSQGESFDTAVKDAYTAFVAYDLPTHRWLQFANDLKIVWFTKYAIRTNKEIIKNLAESPARVLTVTMLGLLLGLPTVYAGLLFVHRNPLDLFGFTDRFISGAALHPTIQAIR